MNSDDTWNSLSNTVHKAIRMLEKKDITHAEAFLTSTRTTEVAIRNSEIHTQNSADDCGVGFRVAVGQNKVGFACTNTLNEKAVLETAENAFAIARVSSEERNFALPEARQPPKVKGLFDSRVAQLGVEEGVDVAQRMIQAAEDFDKRVIAKDGRVLFQSGCRGIMNTLGVDFEEPETKATIYLGGGGEQDGEVTSSCYDFMLSRTAEVEPEKVGENVGRRVIEMFKPQPLKSFQGTVVFGPEAVANQLFVVLVDALKGENVATGRSAWTSKLGQNVVSEDLTVTDSALVEKGFASRSFDDEGYPSQNTVLMRRGKLESFLHNATSANALKTENTGNASRFAGGFDMVRAIVGNGYRAKPQVHPSNLIIKPGTETKEELASEIRRGVLVESMAGFPQAGSGMISAQLSQAFFVHNGEIKYPIRGGMVSGVAFNWFKQISGIGRDSKQFRNAIVPSLCVDAVKVIGA